MSEAAVAAKPLKLGMNVRDKVSGLTGMIDLYREMLHASAQWAVAPPSKENKLEEGFFFDVVRLEYVDAGISETLPPLQAAIVKLGERYEDTVTGFRGILTDLVWHLNGCVTATLQGKSEDGHKKPEFRSVQQKQLKWIDVGVNTPAVEAHQAKPAAERPGSSPERVSSVISR